MQHQFRYRISYPLIHASLIADFMQNQIPANWIANVNDIYNDLNSAELGTPDFTSVGFNGSEVVSEYSSKYKIYS